MTFRTLISRKTRGTTSTASSRYERQKQRKTFVIIMIGFVGVIIICQRTFYSSYEIDYVSFYDSIFESNSTRTSTIGISIESSPPLLLSEIQDDLTATTQMSTKEEAESKIHVVINAGCNPLQDCKLM
jgi:Trk-type K+ transport system membrane component